MTKRVVIAGQVPPPLGGQNLMVRRLLGLFSDAAGISVAHWRFRFTPLWSEGRRWRLDKGIELVRVWVRLVLLRARGPIDLCIYPSGGPHLIATVRDLLLLPAAHLLCRRVIIHFHAGGQAEFLRRQARWLSAACRLVFKPCFGGIVLTEYGVRDALALGLRRTWVVANGIEDIAGAPVAREEREAVRILYAGHLSEAKGAIALIEAFDRLGRSEPRLTLELAGEPMPPMTWPELRERIGRTASGDRITLHGALDPAELGKIYRRADLFVFSSIDPGETFGLVVVEAMMWSLPVVVTEWRANAEVAGSGGKTVFAGGVVAAVGNGLADGLEAAIAEALRRRAEWPAWGARNRRRFEKLFTIDTFRDRILQVTQEAWSGD